MQRRARGSNLGLVLLLSQIYQAGFNNIPPVTLATLGLNVFLFLKPLKHLMKVCISVNESYYRQDWQRLLLSPFHHADDLHLYFNMVSMLWKGIKLERELGSAQFACIIAVFSQLVGIMYLLLEMVLTEINDDHSYSMQCAVGFSGVLFALKVLNNHYHPGGTSYVMGIAVSNRYTCWVELVLIHVLSPGTSFVGHLSGILVGLLYTKGPLKKIMEASGGVLLHGSSSGQTFYNNAGYSDHRNHHYRQNTQRDFSLYTGGLSEEEQYQRAIRNSFHERGRRWN
ncbi:rhomboid-related protein 4 isoform X2 [Ambystoma mexicanum]|uniref:rhomboid-related protein 4 isoform X2 n=1 Tax=Ambystoma mexicanum TaxID=8296 RepID=UPI0037E88874